jgi:hypothetical protein
VAPPGSGNAPVTSVGNNSCNGDTACAGIIDISIGDCERNAVRLPACP